MSGAVAAPVRVGLMSPLTGLVEMYGAEIVWAAEIACAEVNERGGVLGRPLELLIEDDGSLPLTAVPAAHRLVDAGCVAIIGNLLSNSRIAVADQVASPRGVPYLNFSFYEGSISAREFFHFAALPNQQINRMIPWMAKEFGPKMYFAGNNYEWPRGSIDAAKRALRAFGGDVLGEEYLSIGTSAAEIEALLERVAFSGADVFVPYFAGADQIALLTRFTDLGLKERMAVVMGHYDEVMVSRLPPQVRQGFYSSNTYFMSVDSPENHAYLERLSCRPGVTGIWPAGNGFLSNFGEGTYLSVKAFAAAAEAARSLDTDLLLEALEHVSLRGPQGRVTMDPTTHHAHVNSFLACCRADGTFDIVERFGCLPPEIPGRYRRGTDSDAGDASTHPMPQAAARMAEEAEAAMLKSSAAHQILAAADVALLATDASGFIVEASPQAGEMFGYGPEGLAGMHVQLLIPPHVRAGHAQLMAAFVAGDVRTKQMRGRAELMGYRKDGTFFPLEASIAKVQNGSGCLLVVVTLQDVSERKRAEEELMWKATHDPLTGLPNRALFRERLTSSLERSRRRSTDVALLFVDLDGFKAINDSFGHEAGDALLKSVAAGLIEHVRPGDTVARLAGDEFVVLCEQVEHASAVATLAERLNAVLRRPLEIADGRQIFLSASIGAALGHGSTHCTDDLLRNADAAMYAVKKQGRDSWQLFSESVETESRQRLVISKGLRTALEHDELSMLFQPIVAIESRRVVGAEVLLRWCPPQGEVMPALFVPIAESTGAIVSIGAWAFRQACVAAADWRARFGTYAPYVSVNLSIRQLKAPHLVDDFAAALRESGACPQDLVVEVTETTLMSEIESNQRCLRQIADLGIRVAVDDFGTGFSSVAQLSRLPLSVLKIDRSFIDGIEARRESRIVTAAIIRMGQTLGYQLLAEGVETNAQLTELSMLGCDLGQGYLFGRPMDAVAILDAIGRSVSSEEGVSRKYSAEQTAADAVHDSGEP